MTKHVHEWAIHITGKVHCEECGVVLKPTKADAMLNATERLSAEDAQALATFAGFALMDVPEKMRSPSIIRRIKAAHEYANILEGKDD